MSPSKKSKKKGKDRRPPPRYRKLAKGGTPRATDASTRHSATVPEAAGSIPSHPGPYRRGPSTVVSLEPLSPIIVRSGRPMNAHTDADPARFPPPSTVAGCLRTTWARATGRPLGSALAELRVAGPLLLSDDGLILAPKPADALYFGHRDEARCVRAEPRRFQQGCGADMPDGLLPVRLPAHVEGKPGDGPAWWSWDDLLAFRRGESVPLDRLTRNGWSPPAEGDLRTHVSINPTTGAAVSGNLFQTEGLDLGVYPAAFRTRAVESARVDGLEASDAANGASSRGRRLLVRCAEALDATLVHLGGKRRLAALEPESEERWPTPPDGWLDRIEQTGGLCLTLLTPGIFSVGYRPGWLDRTLTGSPPDAPAVTLRLRAAAVGRWQPHSGWDLAQRRPKPTRKLVTAGATYWFEILDAQEPGALASLWLASVCDDQQDRRDGFGLALPAPWSRSMDDRANA